MIKLASPLFLLFIFLVPIVLYLARRLENRLQGSLQFSNKQLVEGLKPTLRVRLRDKLSYLRGLVLCLLVLAAARPESVLEETKIHVEGIDIVLAIDVSSSMRAMDFEMNLRRVDRLEVVKSVVEEFVEKRVNDRLGIVAFAALAYTACPLTLDHQWLSKNLERVQIGMIKDGTAIGSAIIASLNRLKASGAKEKIIILLTDGRNNAGRISPMVAAEAAKKKAVRIYTIGAGTKGLAPYPVKDTFGNIVLTPLKIDIDDELLRKIAETTGGEYFRATDTESLEMIYDRIDKLEKTPIEETGYNIYNELFKFVLIPAVILLLVEIIISNTYLRRIP